MNPMHAPASCFHIRRAELRDLQALTHLLAQSFHAPDGRIPWFYPLLKLSIQEDLRQRLKSPPPHYICWVAVTPHDGPTHVVSQTGRTIPQASSSKAQATESILGTVELSVRAQQGCSWSGIPGLLLNTSRQSPYVSNLAVQEKARRQGVARQLLERCKDTASQWGYREIFLHVLENNQAARQLYASAGYALQRPDPSWESWLFQQSQRLLLRQPIRRP